MSLAQKLIFALALLVGCCLGCVLLARAWRRRRMPGGAAFVGIVLAGLVWPVADAINLMVSRTSLAVAAFAFCFLLEAADANRSAPPNPSAAGQAKAGLTLVRSNHWLVIRGAHVPGSISINYLEAYCRAGSTDADWVQHTVIRHTNELLSLSSDDKVLRLRDTLADGLVVDHTITAREDEVEFDLLARNPTSQRSEAHWAQPCVRLSAFMGFNEKSAGNATDYLPRCFIFLDGRPARMPTRDWAAQARYIPGQTWCPKQVPRSDVNPRPLSPLVPDNGLIGAWSASEEYIFATAWEPYQELFQGVARCLHSDFRLGGLMPGETKRIRGKIYIVKAKVAELLERYRKDFPEHREKP